jgi:hypothetical protein
MEKEKTENAGETPVVANKEGSPAENFRVSEWREPRWSVVSFEQLVAGGLTYEEAEQKIIDQLNQGVSGLCIVTDEAAKRISEKNT